MKRYAANIPMIFGKLGRMPTGSALTEKEETMDGTKLKPCPFCGTPNTNLYFVKVDAPHGFDTVGIFCNSCKQTVILEENEWEGEDSKTREKAIEAWNRRASDG
jgi:Lar family restriction alleviation protein